MGPPALQLLVVASFVLSSVCSQGYQDQVEYSRDAANYRTTRPGDAVVAVGGSIVDVDSKLEREDPTNNLICRTFKEVSAFYIPTAVVPVLKGRRFKNVYKSSPTETFWIVSPTTFNSLVGKSNKKRIRVSDSAPPDEDETYEYTSLTSDEDEEDLDLQREFIDEVLYSPAPLFSLLCVSPDKPRPFPLLFAPPAPPAPIVPLPALPGLPGLPGLPTLPIIT